MRRRPKAKKETAATRDQPQGRYPDLSEVHLGGADRWVLERDGMQATIDLSSYKSAMLLQVTHERRYCDQCRCPTIHYPSAWLRGDDLDQLIQILRQAKKIWLRAYNQASRARQKADARWDGSLTRQQAADMLNVDARTINRWEERGLIHSLRRISPTDPRGREERRYDPRELAQVAPYGRAANARGRS